MIVHRQETTEALSLQAETPGQSQFHVQLYRRFLTSSAYIIPSVASSRTLIDPVAVRQHRRYRATRERYGNGHQEDL